MPKRPRAHKSVPGTIAGMIRDRILRDELAPGDRLTEATLSRDLRAGQPTVREALFTLERQGLVRRFSRLGTFVTKLDVREVSNLYQIRAELEGLAFEMAGRRSQPADITKLRLLVEDMRSASGRLDRRAYLELDLAFHRKVWELSGNEQLGAILETIVLPLLIFCVTRVPRSNEAVAQAADAHLLLVDAISAGPSQARKAIGKHTRKFFDRYLAAELYSDRPRPAVEKS